MHQYVVIVREVVLRQAARARRGGRERLEATRELVAEVADPPAAEPGGVFGGAAEGWGDWELQRQAAIAEGQEREAWLLGAVGRLPPDLRDTLALVLDDLAFDPEAAALSAVRRDELLEQVRRLPPDLREVVACRYLLELSEAETAAALQVPAGGTVHARLRTFLRPEDDRLCLGVTVSAPWQDPSQPGAGLEAVFALE